MNDATIRIIIGLGVALDEAALQTLDNFVGNSTHGSNREEACRRIICQKLGMDPKLADPADVPGGVPGSVPNRFDEPTSKPIDEPTPDDPLPGGAALDPQE